MLYVCKHNNQSFVKPIKILCSLTIFLNFNFIFKKIINQNLFKSHPIKIIILTQSVSRAKFILNIFMHILRHNAWTARLGIVDNNFTFILQIHKFKRVSRREQNYFLDKQAFIRQQMKGREI